MRVTHDLLCRARSVSDDGERQRLLDEVVLLNHPVALAIARRYRGRGLSDDDLEQVAAVGLVKAVRGFRPEAGYDFMAYAVPTIRGEVRKHFRDQGWMVRPTRRIQELQARITRAEGELAQSLGRSPRPSEVTEYLEESRAEVDEALASFGCFTPASLDRPIGDAGDTPSLGEMIGFDDPEREAVEARVVLAPLVRGLAPRDRRIVELRFFCGWTQQQIATDIGVTQMQVSRLLTRILRHLRHEIESDQKASA